MSKKPHRPASEVVKSIRNHAVGVREAAEGLTERIEQFEVYLGTLKGRVDTVHFGAHPNADPEEKDQLELAIRLHRQDKQWVLSWSSYHPEYPEEYGMEWKPLKKAPLKIKIAAVKMFPDLIEAIEKSQMRLAEEIEAATAQFDAFAETLAKNGKGGA
ncbi:hypothetical protein LCGC14_0225630 [marine sediment metagenome]|uniref:Uncharacterized protein n=1 Tax=marine sediment metagenome TaxID=412755 RepID=A0A0F9UBR5_9ZZZZ|nr:hypothetical protein [Phycisphaerae bacterium]HDZ42984.1 hypothetical protein [Phycisphaerae bacterium]